MVGRSLRGAVGAVGAVSRGLAEKLVTVHLVGADVRVNTLRMGQFQGTVHLVSRDVVETPALPLPVPPVLGCLKHGQSTEDIGPGESKGVLDGTVHVTLGRQVNHAVDVVFLKYSADRLEVADISTHEHVVRSLLDVLQVGQVAGVGQLVQIYDTVLGVLVHEEAHDVATDEARAARYQYIALEFHCKRL